MATADNYPDIALFTKELVKEPRWYTLGIFLGVPTYELDTINLYHSSEGIMRCYIEIHKQLHSTGKPLSWGKIVWCLSTMNNRYLAREIERRYIQHPSPVSNDEHPPSHIADQQQQSIASQSSNSASKNKEDDSPLKDPENSNKEVIEVSQEVKDDFLSLTQRFSALVTDIESAFRSSKVPIQEVQRFIEEECELQPLTGDKATIEKVFSRLHQHYSLLDYRILVSLVQTFLSKKKKLRCKMANYNDAVDRFKSSTSLLDLMSLIKEQATGGKHKIVKLKVRDFWGKATLKKFETMVTEVLDVLYNYTSHISVGRGCICVSWVIPNQLDSSSLSLKPLKFIKIIGVVSLHIGDKEIYNIPGEGCEVMEAAMLQAIGLRNEQAVELLLKVGCDLEVATYMGDYTITNMVHIKGSNNGASSVEHVCIFEDDQKVEEIPDIGGDENEEMRVKMNQNILKECDMLQSNLKEKVQELVKVSNALKSTEARVEELIKEMENKENEIKRLKEKLSELKKPDKEESTKHYEEVGGHLPQVRNAWEEPKGGGKQHNPPVPHDTARPGGNLSYIPKAIAFVQGRKTYVYVYEYATQSWNNFSRSNGHCQIKVIERGRKVFFIHISDELDVTNEREYSLPGTVQVTKTDSLLQIPVTIAGQACLLGIKFHDNDEECHFLLTVAEKIPGFGLPLRGPGAPPHNPVPNRPHNNQPAPGFQPSSLQSTTQKIMDDLEFVEEMNDYGQQLASAISFGMVDDATKLAKLVTDLVLQQKRNSQSSLGMFSLKFELDKEAEPPEEKFTLYLQLEGFGEDPYPLYEVVKPSVTIDQLKSRFQKKFRLFKECQTWIFGDKLADDKQSLRDLGITEEGHTVYIYMQRQKKMKASKASTDVMKKLMKHYL